MLQLNCGKASSGELVTRFTYFTISLNHFLVLKASMNHYEGGVSYAQGVL